MGLFTAFVLVSAMVGAVFWWAYRSMKRRLPPMVNAPEIEPHRIDIGKMDPRRPIDPFSGEPLSDDRNFVVLEGLDGKARDFMVTSDTAQVYGQKGLRAFREPMERLHDDPGELYCLCGRHGLGIVDDVSIAFLYDEIFGGHGIDFRSAFDGLEAHWFRRAAEYGYEYGLDDPLQDLKPKVFLDKGNDES